MMAAARIARLGYFIRTAAGLRARQVGFRLLRALQSRRPASDPSDVRLDGARVAAMRDGAFRLGAFDIAVRRRRAAEVRDGIFVFLAHEERLAPVRWNERHVSHLWSYHLHYFDYLVDLAWAWRETGDPSFAQCGAELVASWLDNDGGMDGWEPYALSSRLLNWIVARLLFAEAWPAPLARRMDASIRRQSRFLRARLEWHIDGNHLLRNLCALLLAEWYLDTGDGRAAPWAFARLQRELDRQILADGMHCERSPMYHALLFADLLLLFACARVVDPIAAGAFSARLTQLSRPLSALTRVDGSWSAFNDCADGMAWRAAPLLRAAGALDVPLAAPSSLVRLSEAGYFGWRIGDERFLIDCGLPGPRWQPGHAHCDLLSFELDLFGVPAIVDAGVAGYAGDPLRAYARSTRAHNTLQVDAIEQSEMWSVFRVARMARPEVARLTGEEGHIEFEGAYTLAGRPDIRHGRRVVREGSSVRIVDTVRGANGCRARVSLHVHPAWSVVPHEHGAVAHHARGSFSVAASGFQRVHLLAGTHAPDQGWYCPAFGVAESAPVLVFEGRCSDLVPLTLTISAGH